MPSPVPAAFSGLTSAPDVLDAFSSVRAYLNGGVTSVDILARSIDTEHVMPADWSAYPVNVFDGEFSQYVGARQETSPEPPLLCDSDMYPTRGGVAYTYDPSNSVSQTTERLTLWPSSVQGSEQMPAPGTALRVECDADGVVDYCCTFMIVLSFDGAYSGHFGNFDIRYRRVGDDGEGTAVSGSDRAISTLVNQSHYHMAVQIPLDAGEWDIWVAYQLGAATSSCWQVTLVDVTTTLAWYRGA